MFYLLCWEGAFATAYEAWIGVSYLSGLAGELRVPIWLVSFLIAVPWIGAVGQLVGAGILERFSSPKQYTIGVAGFARGLWLIPIFFAAYWGFRAHAQGREFPAQRWIWLATGVSCVSALFATSSAAAWMSWMQALIPERLRGRFFGTRQRFNMTAIIAANLIAAICVGWKPHGVFAGYAILGCLGVISGFISIGLASRIPDICPLPEKGEKFRLVQRPDFRRAVRRLLEPLENEEFKNVLIFGAAFNGVVQLTGPFFPYYFTKEQGIPMSLVALWTVLTQVGGFLSAGWWGARIDRDRDPPRLIFWAAHLIALSPLYYVLPGASVIRQFAPFDYIQSGIAWTGYTLAFTALLLKSCPKGRNAVYFAVYTAAAGFAGACGNFLGGQLAQALQPLGGFHALFFVGGAARFLVIWALHGLLTQTTQHRPVLVPSVDSLAVDELEPQHAVLELEDALQQARPQPGDQPAAYPAG